MFSNESSADDFLTKQENGNPFVLNSIILGGVVNRTDRFGEIIISEILVYKDWFNRKKNTNCYLFDKKELKYAENAMQRLEYLVAIFQLPIFGLNWILGYKYSITNRT